MVKTLHLLERPAVSKDVGTFWDEIAVHLGSSLKLLCLWGVHKLIVGHNEKCVRMFDELKLVLVAEDFVSSSRVKIIAKGCHSRSKNASILFVEPDDLPVNLPKDKFSATGEDLFLDVFTKSSKYRRYA